MTILIVDTTVTKIVAVAIGVITAELVTATGLIIEPAFAFCNSSGSCVDITPSGVTVLTPHSIAGTQISSEDKPGAANQDFGNSAVAGAADCGGNPGVSTPNTGILCAP